MDLDADALLAGPRGRRLCLQLALGSEPSAVTPDVERLRLAVFWAAHDLDPGSGTSRVLLTAGTGDPPPRPASSPADVARLVEAVPLDPLAPTALFSALTAAVDSARYWQEPDGEDVLAATPEVRAALARVAVHVAREVESGSATWWTAPLDRAAQRTVRAVGRPDAGPPGDHAADVLARWRDDAVAEEQRAATERPADPRAPWSGIWWSTPPHPLPRTTRTLGPSGPVELWCVEDAVGEDQATVHRVDVPAGAAVHEIDGPDAWLDLCRRHPLDVPASRRHDWFRTTGTEARWAVPDWAAVAREVDAVHLTVVGYLTTAGRALPLGDGRSTVLAGWDPDLTWWLGRRPAQHPDAERWRRHPLDGWVRADA